MRNIDYRFYRRLEVVEKHNAVIESNHLVPRSCRESRWPYTDKLTSDQIVVMRDTFAGHRILPSQGQTVPIYDRLFSQKPGWNPKIHREDTGDVKALGTAARKEDFMKTVPITSNTVYGKRHKDFYDLPMEHRRRFWTKTFLTPSSSLCLPLISHPLPPIKPTLQCCPYDE